MSLPPLVLLSVALTLVVGSANAQEKDKRLHADGKGWGLSKAEIKDDKLPRVLLIGDSVMNGYRHTVYKLLKGKANVDVWVNPLHQASGDLHQKLRDVLAEGPYVVVHFNMGLHGWAKGRIPDGQFEPLTRKLVETLREGAPKAALIWASSTPVTVKGDPEKLSPDINPIIIEHNAMAAKVMKEMNVPVNDLYSLVVPHLKLASGDQFHWTGPAYEMMGKAVVECVLRELAGAKK